MNSTFILVLSPQGTLRQKRKNASKLKNALNEQQAVTSTEQSIIISNQQLEKGEEQT